MKAADQARKREMIGKLQPMTDRTAARRLAKAAGQLAFAARRRARGSLLTPPSPQPSRARGESGASRELALGAAARLRLLESKMIRTGDVEQGYSLVQLEILKSYKFVSKESRARSRTSTQRG
jgi:hypothetical protein